MTIVMVIAGGVGSRMGQSIPSDKNIKLMTLDDLETFKGFLTKKMMI